MKRTLRNAKSEAQASMQRAECFWEAFERSVHRVRYAMTMKAHYGWLHEQELMLPRPRPRLLGVLQIMADGAHDMRITESMNLHALAEQARGAEMMARIWHEEGQDSPSDMDGRERYGRDE